MTREKVRRLGVFGGAFDPPHLAHRELVRCAADTLQLDQLLVLPTGQSWHKARQPSAAMHRVAMARQAFEGIPNVVVDDRETRRPGATYTVETLRELVAQFPNADIHLIIGADQLRAFSHWHQPHEITQIATIIVAKREDSTLDDGQFEFEMSKNLPPGARWRVLPTPLMPVSATDVRARVAQGQGVAELVGPAVARYIAKHHLYSTP